MNTILFWFVAVIAVLVIILLIFWSSRRNSWQSYSMKLMKKAEDQGLIKPLDWSFERETASARYNLGTAGDIQLTVKGMNETELKIFTDNLSFYFEPIYYDHKNNSTPNPKDDSPLPLPEAEEDAFIINYVFQPNLEDEKPTPAIFFIIDPHIKKSDKKKHLYAAKKGPLTETLTVKTGSVKPVLKKNGTQTNIPTPTITTTSYIFSPTNTTDNYSVEILPPDNTIDNVYKMCGAWNYGYDANPPGTAPLP